MIMAPRLDLPALGRFRGAFSRLRRQYRVDHKQSLLRSCAADPGCEGDRRLIRDFRPAFAGEVAKLGEPIREGLILPACYVFL
jgi:hypothetical protein